MLACLPLRRPDFDSSSGKQTVMFLLFIFLFGRLIGYASGSIFGLYVLLSSSENIFHLGDFILHKVFVEGVGDLQPTDEHSGSHIIIAVIHQDQLMLEITDIMFEALSGLHLHRKEVIIVLLKLSLGSILVIEGLLHPSKLQSECLGRE